MPSAGYLSLGVTHVASHQRCRSRFSRTIYETVHVNTKTVPKFPL